MIWAVSENGYIGKDGKLPWNVPAELKHFSKLTKDSTVVMGAKTWESLPTKPLLSRNNIVVSSTLIKAEGATIVTNPFELLKDREDFWVIGGGQLFDFFMPYAEQLHISEVPVTVHKGDVKEPFIDESWNLVFVNKSEEFNYEFYEREL
jgi:dihydrofolate reductase